MKIIDIIILIAVAAGVIISIIWLLCHRRCSGGCSGCGRDCPYKNRRR